MSIQEQANALRQRQIYNGDKQIINQPKNKEFQATDCTVYDQINFPKQKNKESVLSGSITAILPMPSINCSDDSDTGGGRGGGDNDVPDEAVLPEDMEELPGQGAGDRLHLLLHNVRHPRHLQLDNVILTQFKQPWKCEANRQ